MSLLISLWGLKAGMVPSGSLGSSGSLGLSAPGPSSIAPVADEPKGCKYGIHQGEITVELPAVLDRLQLNHQYC